MVVRAGRRLRGVRPSWTKGLRADSNALDWRPGGPGPCFDVEHPHDLLDPSQQTVTDALKQDIEDATSGRALDHRLGREGAPAFGAGHPARSARGALRDFRLGRERVRSWSVLVPVLVPPRVPRRSTGAREGATFLPPEKRFPATKRRSGAARREKSGGSVEKREGAKRQKKKKTSDGSDRDVRLPNRDDGSSGTRFFAGGRLRARETRATRREVRGRHR